MWGRDWAELSARMPPDVRRSLLPWEWSRDRLWTLELEARPLRLELLRHLLDVPLWRGEDDTPFTVRPGDVLAAPARYPAQWRRILEADASFPIDVTYRAGAWIVLDGVHRLASAARLRRSEIVARVVPPELYAAFAVPRDASAMAAPERGGAPGGGAADFAGWRGSASSPAAGTARG